MNFNKCVLCGVKNSYIPWKDMCVYGGMSLFGITCIVIGIVTKQVWSIGGIVSLVLSGTTFLIVGIVVIIKKWRSRPDYVGKYGAIWLCDGIKISHTINVLCFFIHSFPKLYNVKQKDLENMIEQMELVWWPNPIPYTGGKTIFASGLQRYRHIDVYFRNRDIANTSLYHELAHMIHEMIEYRSVDWEHGDIKIWGAVKKCCENYKSFLLSSKFK